MKKRFCILFTVLFVLFVVGVQVVNAQDPNAGGITGNTGNTLSTDDLNSPYNMGGNLFLKLNLIYYDAATGNQNQIGSSVYITEHATAETLSSSGADLGDLYRNVTPKIVKPSWFGTSIDGGSLTFNYNQFKKDTVGDVNASISSRRAVLKAFVQSTLGINIDTLENKESCNVAIEGEGNCYHKSGYRLKGELYTVRGNANPVSLKEFARGCGSGTPGQGCGSLDGQVAKNTKLYSGRMKLDWADINYYGIGGGGNNKGDMKVECNGSSAESCQSLDCLKDSNCGWGIWLVDISQFISSKHDYSLDSACVNCSSAASTGKSSYVIQDTTNWDDIKDVKNLTGDNASTIKNYFKKSVNNNLCREEYQITFPENDNDLIVESGRYFTINIGDDKTAMKPVTIKRIIQCVKQDGTAGNLNAMKTQYCGTPSAGKMKLLYKEVASSNNKYQAYQSDGWYTMNTSSPAVCTTYMSDADGTANNVATIEITSDYVLPNKAFRYIRLQDGLSFNRLPDSSVINKEFKDVGFPNLPIALNHTVAEPHTTAAYVSLKFDFPNDSNMSDAFNSTNNDYLAQDGVENSESNIYYLYKHNKINEGTDAEKAAKNAAIKSSACAKMFGYGSDAFKSCASSRATSIKAKINSCRSQNKAVDTNTSLSTNVGYTCAVYMNPGSSEDCDSGDPDCPKSCTTEDEAKEQGRHWGKKRGSNDFVCCDYNDDWDEDNKTCYKDPIPNCNSKTDADNLGKKWGEDKYGNSICCEPSDYDKETGKCYKDDPSCVPGTADCPNTCTTEAEAKAQGKVWATLTGTSTKVCCDPKDYNSSTNKCDPCKTEDDAKKMSRDWNPTSNTCCNPGYHYNTTTKKCEGKPDPKCYDGVNGTCANNACKCPDGTACPVNGTCPSTSTYSCRIVSGKYYTKYPDTNSEVSKEEYIAAGCAGTEDDCKALGLSWNPVTNTCDDKNECELKGCEDACCPDNTCGVKVGDALVCTTTTCLTPPCKPTSATLLYRPIDLTNSFIGKAGAIRNVGSNWASYSPTENKYNYSSSNAIVNSIIKKGTSSGTAVYDSEHVLYKVTLDSKSISKIRSYNKSTSYDDFNLECKDGESCISAFLNNTSNFKNGVVEGKCANATHSNFYQELCGN